MAHVLELAARLADFRFLEAHARAGTPAKDGEWTVADLAFLTVPFFHLEERSRSSGVKPRMSTYHSNVRVVAETCLTENWELLDEQN